LARLRLTKYRFDDVPTGFTIGQNLVGYRRTDMSWVVIAGYAPEQVAVFKTRCQPKSAGLSVSTKEDCWFAAENLKLAEN
jgi:hypothetical protein